ncbi:hypothetical protein BDDG_11956 [Blastomyces dermatitidis ATCC 18188]|uniref:Uncharacterized protein n=1 Tax=Ajellomyces dermatitidis (strain ATCC 18188 / CBS 674.68) TaxID=653446 RepID=A0A0J9EM62_AJEDA|nr:hypothetical protein BDDG_11956 [Blastomyces dermatitidis ATCC 18188]
MGYRGYHIGTLGGLVIVGYHGYHIGTLGGLVIALGGLVIALGGLVIAVGGLVIVGYHGYHGVSSLSWVIIWAFNSPGIMVIGIMVISIMVIGIPIVLVLILAVMVMIMSVTLLTPWVMIISMISLIPRGYGFDYGYDLVKSDLWIHSIFDIDIVIGIVIGHHRHWGLASYRHCGLASLSVFPHPSEQ